MGSTQKIVLLVFSLLGLIIYSVLSFDYDSFTKKDKNFVQKEKKEKILKKERISFVILKHENIVSISGNFINKIQLTNFVDYLNLNKQSPSTYNAKLTFDKNNIDTIKAIVSPLKDYFASDSKIILKNGKISVEGSLKEKRFEGLVNAILAKTPNVKLIRIKKEEVPKKEVKKEKIVIEAVKKEIKINLQEEINNLLKEEKITFKRRSVEVSKESLFVLNKIAELLKGSDKIAIEIAGHTDAKGRRALNKSISQKRALSVKNELIKLGINKKILKAIGYGEDRPLVKNDKNGLSEINRRVEFIVTDFVALEEKQEEFQDRINELLEKEKIVFKRRSYDIVENSKKTIKELALILKNKDITSVEVAGHTDAKGKEELNKTISKLRALSVKNALVKEGVKRRKLKAVGYGESQPLVKNDENGLSKINRRVEIYIKGVK